MPTKRAVQRNRKSIADSGGEKQKQQNKESVRPTGISGRTVATRAVASGQERENSNIGDTTFVQVSMADDVPMDEEVTLQAGRGNTVTGNFVQLDSTILIGTTNQNVMGVEAVTAVEPNEMDEADDMVDRRQATVEEANRIRRMGREKEDGGATTDAAVLVEVSTR